MTLAVLGLVGVACAAPKTEAAPVAPSGKPSSASGPSPSDEAEAQLRDATTLEDVSVGDDGESHHVAAYRALFLARDAADRFERLLETAQPAGRLYGLCGLFFLRPSSYRRGLAELWDASAATIVSTLSGCIGETARVRDVLGARTPQVPPPPSEVGGTIANGEICRSLSGQRVRRPLMHEPRRLGARTE